MHQWTCSSVGRVSDHHATDAGSIPWCGKGLFFPQSQLSVQTFFCGVCTPLCAITCINTCMHVKDPVVHVRVRWIIEILKHQPCAIGWVTWLCCSWLSPGKATRIAYGRNSNGTMQLYKKKKLVIKKQTVLCQFSGLWCNYVWQSWGVVASSHYVGCAAGQTHNHGAMQLASTSTLPFLMALFKWNILS